MVVESQGPCPGNCLGPAVDAELASDVACVDLDRVPREVGPEGDFTTGRSIGEEDEDFQLGLRRRDIAFGAQKRCVHASSML